MNEDIASVVYAEARGESTEGKRAVAHVVLNRVKKGSWGNSVASVVRAAGQFVRKFGSGATWQRCLEIAKSPGPDPTGGALYFATYRAWPRKRFHGKIGSHYFFS